MNFDCEPGAAESLCERIGRGLADEMRVMIGEDVETPQACRRREGFDAVGADRGPDRNPEQLAGGKRALGAFGDAENSIDWLVESDPAPLMVDTAGIAFLRGSTLAR